MSDTPQRDNRASSERGKGTGGRPGRRDGGRAGSPAGFSGARGQRGDRASDQQSDAGRSGGQRSGGQGSGGGRGRDGAPVGRGRGSASGEQRLWTRDGKPARGDRDARVREPEVDRDPFNTRSVRPRHDDPDIPASVTPDSLDRVARNELKTLTKENQEFVARHLAMAAILIDDDPELAHRHATSAARRGGRIGVVRETLAITAYATGDYALALRELRTYRRITGRDDQLPMMVDSERGLGRPDRALELGRSVPRASLPVPVQVELAIAMSGARLDQGSPELALDELRIPQLDPATAYSYSPALFSAYATVLEDLGRESEAQEWFARADVAAQALGVDTEDDLIEVVEEDVDLDDTEAHPGPGAQSND